MLKKDVELHVEYAATVHGTIHGAMNGRAVREGRFEHVKAHEMESLGSSLQRVRVVELDVLPYLGRAGGSKWGSTPRAGVKVEWADPATGEKRSWGSTNGEEHWTRWMAYGQLVMPWERWTQAWGDFLTRAEDEAERRRVEREQEEARRQEKAAKEWMERTFAHHREALLDAARVLLDGEDPSAVVGDEQVRAYVELREPEGNPYLNGRIRA